MTYQHIMHGTFLSRPNRFIAHVMIGGREEICHVKNTGRCKELLVPGAKLVLEHHPDSARTKRKTSYDVIGVYKEHAGSKNQQKLINIDSQAPNTVAWEWLNRGGLSVPFPEISNITQIKREVCCRNSRFDLAFLANGKQCYMEVKGVTLEHQGIAAFPDAPTQRGVRHLEELTALSQEGIRTFLLLVIQMNDILRFRPNMKTHPEFGHALVRAKEAGVSILAYDCLTGDHFLSIRNPVPIDLSEVAAKTSTRTSTDS